MRTFGAASPSSPGPDPEPGALVTVPVVGVTTGGGLPTDGEVPADGLGGVFAHDGLPGEGVLEELDGRPIGRGAAVPLHAAPPRPWRLGAAAATAVAVRRPSLWAFALVAFLARGGLLLLLLPIVVVPTFIGLANFVGPASVTAGGPGPRLVALVAAGLTAGLALAVLGTVLAAAAEVALHRATAATPEARSLVADDVVAGRATDEAIPGAAGEAWVALQGAEERQTSLAHEAREASPAPAAREASPAPAVARVAVIRLVLLVPVAIVVALAIPTWVAVAYRELTLPSDLAAPLAARILAGAPAASVAVFAAWLAAEVVGGFAARRAALFGASTWRALAGGFLDPPRAPVGTILTVATALGLSVVLLVPAIWALDATWDLARRALGGGSDPLAAFGAALLLAAVWLAALVLAALAAAWRATLVTMELLRRRG